MNIFHTVKQVGGVNALGMHFIQSTSTRAESIDIHSNISCSVLSLYMYACKYVCVFIL